MVEEELSTGAVDMGSSAASTTGSGSEMGAVSGVVEVED